MLLIEASGTPYDIGHAHGTQAKSQIHSTLAYYTTFFEHQSNLTWPAVRRAAEPFAAALETSHPTLHAELRGLSDGAALPLIDAVALNARTEIAFGLFADGCTSAYAANAATHAPLLGQNWDWAPAQRANLVRVRAAPTGAPPFDIVTEAGLLGKIGINGAGVGVCLNALRAKGADPRRLPVHLALRAALGYASAEEAAGALERDGVAASAYILLGDARGAVGLECSASTVRRHAPDQRGLLAHANHMVLAHGDAGDGAIAAGEKSFWPDSLQRMPRMQALLETAAERGGGAVSAEDFCGLFLDRDGYPCSIDRVAEGKSQIETLFNIVMEPAKRRATVKVGRPSHVEETIVLGEWN